MRHPIYALALSLSVLTVSALPAHAQLRRSVGAQPASPQGAEAAGLAPVNRTNLQSFIGPAFEGGNRATVLTRTRTSNVAPTTAPTGANFTNTNTTTSTVTQETIGNAWGVMYGLGGTWWGSERMGLGGSLFGAYLGAGYSTNLLHTTPMPANKDEGGNTTTLSETVNLNQGYSLSINPTPVGGGVASSVYGGFVGGNMTLRQGSQTGANPESYNSTGGVNYAVNRSLWLNDFGVNGEYVLAEAPAGGVSFFGGLTIPVGTLSRSTTVKTVGANGSGDTAEEVESVDDGGGATYTRKTQFRVNESTKADSSFSAAGPMIGLNAHYNLSPSLRLYTKLGYAPALVGVISTTQTTTRNDSRATVIENVSTAASTAGVVAGTQTRVNNTATPQQSVASFGGTETTGTVGLAFRAANLNLSAEGLARAYSLAGGALTPELIYGLRLGAGFYF